MVGQIGARAWRVASDPLDQECAGATAAIPAAVARLALVCLPFFFVVGLLVILLARLFRVLGSRFCWRGGLGQRFRGLLRNWRMSGGRRRLCRGLWRRFLCRFGRGLLRRLWRRFLCRFGCGLFRRLWRRFLCRFGCGLFRRLCHGLLRRLLRRLCCGSFCDGWLGGRCRTRGFDWPRLHLDGLRGR
jgi:hypothetical protein